jgi:hypothetical protein
VPLLSGFQQGVCGLAELPKHVLVPGHGLIDGTGAPGTVATSGD